MLLGSGGVAKDDARAVELFRKGCDAGVAMGCLDLGVMVASGRGVTKDPKKARELFDQACQAGVTDGCDKLKKLQGKK
jgi:uncharacterized protein